MTRRFEELRDVAHRAADGHVQDDVAAAGEARAVAAMRELHALPWRRARPAILLAAAAIAALLCGLLLRPHDEVLTWTGAEGGYVTTRASSDAVVRFSNGTVATFAPQSRARVAPMTTRGARVTLEEGTVTVRADGKKHLLAFRFDAGPFVVEPAPGSEMSLRWLPVSERLEVDVREGTAVLSGGPVREHLTIGRGQRAVADLATASVGLGSLEPVARAQPPEAAAAPPPVPPATDAEPLSTTPALLRWTEMVARGHFAAVVADAEAHGVESSLAQRSLADLGALGDAARYLGRRDLARRAFVAQRTRFPRTTAASNAAFQLGRLADDDGRQTEAIGWYDRYLVEAENGPLAAEALGRLLVATSRVSGPSAARPIADRYLARFPQGAHAAIARDIARP